MLQQTRVAAMLPRYEAFLRDFPDLESLALADPERVLSAWSGLGYYSRARNAHACARAIVLAGGSFPQTERAMLTLPGIGKYTAAAVLSQAFGVCIATVDGNVRRVLMRHSGITSGEVPDRAKALIEKKGAGDPGMHNQALMELGAMVCLPGRPDCKSCPLHRTCRARKSGKYDVTQKKKMINLALDILFLEFCAELVFFKSSKARFFKNLWFLPLRFHDGYDILPEISGLMHSSNVKEIRSHQKIINHAITDHRIKASVIHIRIKRMQEGPHWKLVSVENFLEECVPSLGHKAFKLFRQLQDDTAAS